MSGSVVTDEDRAFLHRFEQCELPESEWTHLAHVRVAWIYLNTSARERAKHSIRSSILRYNTKVLKRRHKYHETVTVAFVHLIAARMRPDEPWTSYSGRIDDLLDTDYPVLLRYYSKGRLFSEIAREQFLEPDLREIPPLSI